MGAAPFRDGIDEWERRSVERYAAAARDEQVEGDWLLERILYWYGHYVNGHLPRGGGVAENNARLMRLFMRFKVAESAEVSRKRDDAEADAARKQALSTGKVVARRVKRR